MLGMTICPKCAAETPSAVIKCKVCNHQRKAVSTRVNKGLDSKMKQIKECEERYRLCDKGLAEFRAGIDKVVNKTRNRLSKKVEHHRNLAIQWEQKMEEEVQNIIRPYTEEFNSRQAALKEAETNLNRLLV